MLIIVNKMQLSINERISLLVKEKANDSQAVFANAIGVKPTVINNIVAGRMSEPSFQTLLKIIIAYPDISSDWLLLGTGEMLKEESSNFNSDDKNDELKRNSYSVKNKKNLYVKDSEAVTIANERSNVYEGANVLLLQKRIEELEDLVQELKEDKRNLQKMLDFLQNNINKS